MHYLLLLRSGAHGHRCVCREEETVTLEKLEADLEAENPWERVVTLVDTAKEMKEDDGSDVSRMRGLLIQLKTESLSVSDCFLTFIISHTSHLCSHVGIPREVCSCWLCLRHVKQS